MEREGMQAGGWMRMETAWQSIRFCCGGGGGGTSWQFELVSMSGVVGEKRGSIIDERVRG